MRFISIIEQMRLVEAECHHEIQVVLMWICLAAISCVLIAYLLRVLGKFIARYTEIISRKSRLTQIVSIVGLCVSIIYGGSKHPSITWDTGLRDNGSIFDTNTWNSVTFKWAKTDSSLPDEQTIFFAYRPKNFGSEWELLSQSYVGAMSNSVYLANATNYCFYGYTSYVPPTPVHTNGVWVGNVLMRQRGGRTDADPNFVVIHGRVEENGTPKTINKEDEQ